MDYFTEGFTVRTPSWHRKETLVMDDLVLPRDRPKAMKLAGHDFTVIERPLVVVGANAVPASYDGAYARGPKGTYRPIKAAKGFKALMIEGEDNVLNVVRKSYVIVQNDTGWDVLEAIVGEGAKLDAGMRLKDGAICIVTAFLDEPVKIDGDDSLTLPYIVVRWTHDGSGALSTRYTSVRVVCANTDEMAQAESKRTGREFTFRHTKNVMERIEDAKMALQGIRVQHEEYVELANELAATPVSDDKRELFVTQFLPMPPEALISDRVAKNVEEARDAVRAIFNSPTIPVVHRNTAYGLRLAGVEYLDHLRGYKNADTYVGRQLLRLEPAKAKLATLIKEVVAA